jgi:hypothetical protein
VLRVNLGAAVSPGGRATLLQGSLLRACVGGFDIDFGWDVHFAAMSSLALREGESLPGALDHPFTRCWLTLLHIHHRIGNRLLTLRKL